MGCSACAERRRKLKEKLAEKKARKQGVQAAAITAVLAITEVAGKAIGIKGEEDERDTQASDTTRIP